MLKACGGGTVRLPSLCVGMLGNITLIGTVPGSYPSGPFGGPGPAGAGRGMRKRIGRRERSRKREGGGEEERALKSFRVMRISGLCMCKKGNLESRQYQQLPLHASASTRRCLRPTPHQEAASAPTRGRGCLGPNKRQRVPRPQQEAEAG